MDRAERTKIVPLPEQLESESLDDWENREMKVQKKRER